MADWTCGAQNVIPDKSILKTALFGPPEVYAEPPGRSNGCFLRKHQDFEPSVGKTGLPERDPVENGKEMKNGEPDREPMPEESRNRAADEPYCVPIALS